MGAGGIVLFEYSRLHLYSSDLVFQRTLPVTGVVRSVLWDPLAAGWLVSYTDVSERPDPNRSRIPRMDARILVLDRDGDTIRSMQADEAMLGHSAGGHDPRRGRHDLDHVGRGNGAGLRPGSATGRLAATGTARDGRMEP